MTRNAIQAFLFGRPVSAARPHAIAWPRVELIGRILLASIFMISGVAKFLDWNGTAGHMAAEGIPAIALLLPLAALVEIAGGLSLITGTFARAGALALIGFLIPTTLIFHDFWTYEGTGQVAQLASFFKNLGLMGGLLLVVSHGTGRLSVDDKLERRLAD